jgi:hypothetical protein
MDVTTDSRTDDVIALVRQRISLERQFAKIHQYLTQYIETGSLPKEAVTAAEEEVRRESLGGYWGWWHSSAVAQQTEAFLRQSQSEHNVEQKNIAELLGLTLEDFKSMMDEVEEEVENNHGVQRFVSEKVSDIVDRAWRKAQVFEIKKDLEARLSEIVLKVTGENKAKIAEISRTVEELERTTKSLAAKNLEELVGMLYLSSIGAAFALPIRVYGDRCTGLEYDNLIRAVEQTVAQLGFEEKILLKGVR